MNDPIETMQREPTEDPDVPEARPVKRQPAWNALRRRMPVEAGLVVRQPPILLAFQKPLKPVGVKR